MNCDSKCAQDRCVEFKKFFLPIILLFFKNQMHCGHFHKILNKIELLQLDWAHMMTNKERAAIYVSLAQTYADLGQFDTAVFYYQKELEENGDNHEQVCLHSIQFNPGILLLIKFIHSNVASSKGNQSQMCGGH